MMQSPLVSLCISSITCCGETDSRSASCRSRKAASRASTGESADAISPTPRRRLPILSRPLTSVEHVGEHRLDIADDRNIDLDVLRNRRRIDIDMDDGLRLGREVRDAAGDAIVEARADRDQAIGIADRRVGAVRAVHPEHPETQRIGGRERPQAHQGLGHRDAEAARKLRQLGRRTRPLHAAADVEERLLAFSIASIARSIWRGLPLNRRLVAAQYRPCPDT